jgi:hypothetical protein
MSQAEAPGGPNVLVRHGKGFKYEKRNIEINVQSPQYGDNSIRTSKYKNWNFFFLNLFEQFKKPANVYFLVNAKLQDLNMSSSNTGHIDFRRDTDYLTTPSDSDSGLDAKRLS